MFLFEWCLQKVKFIYCFQLCEKKCGAIFCLYIFENDELTYIKLYINRFIFLGKLFCKYKMLPKTEYQR